MRSFYLMISVTVIAQIVYGVPLLNIVKRQIPQETNEQGETYPAENPLGVQNNIDIVSQPNNVPSEEKVSPNNDAPKVDPNAPMVGADNSPYRKYHYAPGYGGTAAAPDNVDTQVVDENGDAGAALGNNDIAPGSNEPEIPPAIPVSPADDVEVMPGNQNTGVNSPYIPQSQDSPQNQYETIEGQPVYAVQQNPNLPAGVPPPDYGVQGNLNPADGVQQPGYGVQENMNPPTNYGVQENPNSPANYGVQENLNPVDTVPQPGYGVQENMNPPTNYGVQENPNSPANYGVQENLNPVDTVPQPGYGVQENMNSPTNYGAQENPNLPADYGVQENQPAAVPQPDYGVPQNPNDVNPQYNPNDPQIGIGGPVETGPFAPQNQQPEQPDSGLNLPQNQITDHQYNPYGASGTGLQQPVQGLPVQNPDDANQQYSPHQPLQQTELGPPLQQTELGPPLQQLDEIEQFQNKFGDTNQQYNPNPPEVPGSLENQPTGVLVQPQSGYGMPLQGGNTPYEPAIEYQNIPGQDYVEQPIQPALPDINPVVNTTEPPQYDTIGTEIPDSAFWPDSENYDNYNADNWVDQYYSYDSEDENVPVFDNQEIEQKPFEWWSSDEPFDPYESLDDESYENILKQEIEDFKDVGLFDNSFGKQDSPTDRLQPNVYTNWQIENSQPPSTLNSQAANNFLLYCIPAVLLTLVLYIGYSNYNRKPRIVNIPSGNNWRAEYRDIEAKSKEIEPMLRKSEMY